MLSSREIRKQFIDFFVERCGHTFVPASSVVPHDDPTLLFTNAGMNQFKDVFLGVGERDYTRAVNSQKCIRAGGKHNDLDDVGKDTYHHTFFEMLGNWSFGDYFKREAIQFAWELLTDVWGLEKDRLHVTVFEGDPALGIEPDTEAEQLWQEVTDIDPSHITRWGKEENFWEMGDTGPCGPCSEIHIDLTPDKTGASRVNRDDPEVVELWNLVFIQFNRDAKGKLTTLPAKHVDTGMGFERLCAVLQNKPSNYDTDVFTPLFEAIQQITGAPAYSGKLHSSMDVAYRVIADHARCLTFAITDGAVPSNEGRGYVLRRILRRGVRYGRQHLNMGEPFLYRLVPVVAEHMGEIFPEITKDTEYVAEIIRQEETSFLRTLDRGIELFDQAADRTESAGQKILPGEDAFKLYDTFGFPLDLTQLMAEERDMEVDVDGFHKLMEEARQRSRAEGGKGDEARQSLADVVRNQKLPNTKFVGYSEVVVDGTHAAEVLVKNEDHFEPADTLEVGQDAAVIVGRTPFYAEAGGQVGDSGTIHSTRGGVFRVDDTVKVGNVYFHLGQLEEGNVSRGSPAFSEEDPLLLEIDQPRRRLIRMHHTVTHLLNWALREVLGEHVQQRGSLVDEEKTRFDFSHTQSLTRDQIKKIQKLVNERIKQDLPVYAAIVDKDDALKINGIRAVFGEKYPDKVRVVSIGMPVEDMLKHPDRDEWRQYSVELCGGTHLHSTGAAKRFVTVNEEGVSKGVRRLVGIGGDPAERAASQTEVLNDRIEALRDERPESLEQDLASITETMSSATLPLVARKRLRKKCDELQEVVKAHQKAKAKEAEGHVVEEARRLAEETEGQLVVAAIDNADSEKLRKAMDVIRSKRPEAAMLLAAPGDKKVTFLAAVPQELIDKGLKAGDWVSDVAKVADGGGGGRPDMAQAGGKNPAKLNDALETARRIGEEKIAHKV